MTTMELIAWLPGTENFVGQNGGAYFFVSPFARQAIKETLLHSAIEKYGYMMLPAPIAARDPIVPADIIKIAEKLEKETPPEFPHEYDHDED